MIAQQWKHVLETNRSFIKENISWSMLCFQFACFNFFKFFLNCKLILSILYVWNSSLYSPFQVCFDAALALPKTQSWILNGVFINPWWGSFFPWRKLQTPRKHFANFHIDITSWRVSSATQACVCCNNCSPIWYGIRGFLKRTEGTWTENKNWERSTKQTIIFKDYFILTGILACIVTQSDK